MLASAHRTSPPLASATVSVALTDDEHVSASGYEARVQASATSKEPPNLIHFPERDLSVQHVARQLPSSADAALLSAARGYVVSCLRRYTRDWTTLDAHHDAHDGKTTLAPAVPPPDVPLTELSTEVEAAEPLSPHYLEPFDRVLTLKRGASHRDTLAHHNLFAHYTPSQAPERPSDPRMPVPAPEATRSSSSTSHAFVTVKSLTFVDGVTKQLEPFFLSLAIFDAHKKERVTETVHMQCLNPEHINHMLGERWNQVVDELRGNQALFPLDDLSPDLYLVMLLEKTLRGADVDHAVDELYKHSTLRPRAQAKVEDEARVSAVRLGAYRQPLAWSARCLFEKGRSMVGHDVVFDGFVKFRPGVPMSDAHIIAQLATRAGGATMRGGAQKAGGVPVQIVIDFDLLDAMPKLAANVHVAQLFSSPENVTDPHREIVNDMYVFMEGLNLSALGRHVRNVAIHAALYAGDDRPGHPHARLPVMYGRTKPLESEALCCVQYHESRPSLYDQIKIRLPSVLHTGHHLLLTFSHVQCRASSFHDERESVVGYAVFPLFPNNRVVQDGSYSIPVIASTLPAGYFSSADVESTLEYLDNKRPLVFFRTKLVSTIYTQDAPLDDWFRQPITGETMMNINCCDSLARAAVYEKIRFMPAIFDRLWEAMCVGGRQAGVAALLQAADLCERVTMANNRGVRMTMLEAEAVMSRNRHLVAYVQHEYEEDPDAFEGVPRARVRLPYQALAASMASVFSSDDGAAAVAVATCSWFFFDLMVKSIALHLHRSGTLSSGGAVPRDTRVARDSLMPVERAVLSAGRALRQRTWAMGALLPSLNTFVGLFLKDLLSLVDRGWAMDLLAQYLECLTPPANEERLFFGLQWKVLRIVSDHPHFVPLNLPIPKKLGPAATLCNSFYRNHFLAGLLLRSARSCLDSADVKVRQYAITVLRETMRKHDGDARYQVSLTKKRVVRIYFPYVLILLQRVEHMESSMDVAELRDWLLPLLWIVRYSNRRTVLHKWWLHDTIRSQRLFLRLLQLCVSSFAYSTALASETALLVLDVLDPFMLDLQEAIASQEPLFDELFATLHLLLKSEHRNLSSGIVLALFDSLKVFIQLFAEPLFVRSHSSSHCGDMAFQILQFCNVADGRVRSAAAALLYLLMRTNFRVRGNFARMKIQSTVGVSKLQSSSASAVVARGITQGYLEKSLEAVANRALGEFGGDNNPFAQQVQQLAKTLFRVIRDSARIQQYKHDRERMCDYMYQVSLGYATDSPDLRVTWLSNLADYHLLNKNYEEHAQCKLLAAALVCQYLHQSDADAALKAGVPASLEAFAGVCPNVMSQPPLQDFHEETMEEGIYESRQFSLSGLMDLLKEVLLSLRSGARYELAIEVFNMVVTLHQYQRKYELMATAFAEMRALVQQMLEADAVGSRSFAGYYRVNFLGAAWGADLAGKTYIYRADEFSQIADVTEMLEAQFRKVQPSLTRLGNKDASEYASEMQPDVCYWQIAAVKEYFDATEVLRPRQSSAAPATPAPAVTVSVAAVPASPVSASASPALSSKDPRKRLLGAQDPTHMRRQSLISMDAASLRPSKLVVPVAEQTVVPWEVRTTRWEHKFNVRRFLLVQPFSKGGKKDQQEGRPEDQWKRKTVYTCETAFPFVNTRILVTNVETTELSPIETTIEMINEQGGTPTKCGWMLSSLTFFF